MEKIFRKHSKRRIHSILDVGCGTGNHAYILAKRGYEVVGIDQSSQMLQAAREKASRSSHNPEFHEMDMRNITLRRVFDTAMVLFGAFDYLIKDRDVSRCLTSLWKHLRSRRLLIYEFWQNSGILPAAATPRGSRYWDRIETPNQPLLIRLSTGRYDALTNLLTIMFDHYVIDTARKLLIDTFQESHVLRTYTVSEMKHLLKENGFEPLAFYEKPSETQELKPPTPSSSRIICVARRSE